MKSLWRNEVAESREMKRSSPPQSADGSTFALAKAGLQLSLIATTVLEPLVGLRAVI
jgi:hypothetical protein